MNLIISQSTLYSDKEDAMNVLSFLDRLHVVIEVFSGPFLAPSSSRSLILYRRCSLAITTATTPRHT